jgi:hypothetical protein
VELEIDPEPSPEEREAILRALEGQSADGRVPAAYLSAWWADGVRENTVDPGAQEPVES